MYISNDRNSVNKEQPNMPPASKNGQFGSMNPNLYTVLIIIGVINLLLIGYWVLPRAVSLYYQTKGGQVVDRVLSRGQKTQWDSIACASPPTADSSTKEILARAEGDLERAIRFSSDDAHPQLLIGRTYCMLGEPEKAIVAYQEYVRLRPANPLGQLELGFAYEAACKSELESRGGATDLRPEQQRCTIPEYHEAMIAAWKAAGLTTQDFIDTGESARTNGRNNDALAWFRRASEFSPDSGAPWFYIGEVYTSINGPRVAADSYRKALDLGYAESINALMDDYIEDGNDQAQLDLLITALDRFPAHAEREAWWKMLGEKYMELEDWQAAIQVYEDAIIEYPDNPGFHLNLGLAYYEVGENATRATDEIKQSISLDPDNGIGYYSLARILTREKRYAEADNWFKRALEKNPASNWWQLTRANAARASGNLALAEQEYLAIIDRSPNFTSAYYELALLYRLKEQADQSVEAISKAIQLSANPSQEYFLRAGSIYEWVGDIEKAIDAYRNVLSINPQNEVALNKVKSLSEVEN